MPSETRPIATPATGAAIGTPASMSARVPPHTVAIEEEPLDSRMSETTRSVYGNVFASRHHRRQRAAGQVAVADLAPAGAAQELHLAHGERREVVVQQEALLALALQRLDDLDVLGGAEGAGHQRLGLAAGEERGAVGAGQEADLAGDLADLVEGAAVEALALVEHRLAELVLDHLVEDRLDPAAPARRVSSSGREATASSSTVVDGVVPASSLPRTRSAASSGAAKRARIAAANSAGHGGAAAAIHAGFGLPTCACRRRWAAMMSLISRWARSMASRICASETPRGAGLDHHDRVLGAGDDDLERGLGALLVGRVDDAAGPPIEADADRADRRVERAAGEHQRRRGAVDREHVGVVVAVGRQHASPTICVSWV